jgi:hypothetical protein
MPDNSQKLQLIQAIRQSGYPGSVTEVFQAYDQGQDLVGQWVQQQEQQQQMQEMQQQGPQGPQGMAQGGPSLPPPNRKPDGRVSQPDVNQPLSNDQGHLVQSQNTQNVGIQDLPTGPAQSQRIQARDGGVRQYHEGGAGNVPFDDPQGGTNHMQLPHHTGGNTGSSSMYNPNDEYNQAGQIDYGLSWGSGGQGFGPIISGEGAKQIGEWGKGVWDKSSNLGKAGIVASGIAAPVAGLAMGLNPTKWLSKTGGVRQSKSYINKYSHGGPHLGGSQYAFGLGPQTSTSVMDRYSANQPSLMNMDFSNTGNLFQRYREYENALKAQETQNQRFQTTLDEGSFSSAFGKAYDYYPTGENFNWRGNPYKSERSSDAYKRIMTEGWKGPIPQGILDAYSGTGTTTDPSTGLVSGFEGIDPNQFRPGSHEWQYLVGNPKYSGTQNKNLYNQFETYAKTDQNREYNTSLIEKGIEEGSWTQSDIDAIDKTGETTSSDLLNTLLTNSGQLNQDGLPQYGSWYNTERQAYNESGQYTGPNITKLSKKEEDNNDYVSPNDKQFVHAAESTGVQFMDNASLNNVTPTTSNTITLSDGSTVNQPVQQTWRSISEAEYNQGVAQNRQREQMEKFANNPHMRSFAAIGYANPGGLNDPSQIYRQARGNFGLIAPIAAPAAVVTAGTIAGAGLATLPTWASTGFNVASGGYGLNQMFKPFSSEYGSAQNFYNDPTLSNFGTLGMDALWTVPGMGMAFKYGRTLPFKQTSQHLLGQAVTGAKSIGTGAKTTFTKMPFRSTLSRIGDGTSTLPINTKHGIGSNLMNRFGNTSLGRTFKTNVQNTQKGWNLLTKPKSTPFESPMSTRLFTNKNMIKVPTGSNTFKTIAPGSQINTAGGAYNMFRGAVGTGYSALKTATMPLSMYGIGEHLSSPSNFTNLDKNLDFGTDLANTVFGGQLIGDALKVGTYTAQGKKEKAATQAVGLLSPFKTVTKFKKTYDKIKGFGDPNKFFSQSTTSPPLQINPNATNLFKT